MTPPIDPVEETSIEKDADTVSEYLTNIGSKQAMRAFDALDRILTENKRLRWLCKNAGQEINRLEDEIIVIEAEVEELTLEKQRGEAARQALEQIASLVDGQEGRSAQTMMMHGFSPVKALGQARDIAREALRISQGDSK